MAMLGRMSIPSAVSFREGFPRRDVPMDRERDDPLQLCPLAESTARWFQQDGYW